MIPNYIRKYINGWTNHSGMVISHKMNENEMGYRGSKSITKFVKEQRVYGNWWIRPIHLRCTLMDCENSYQIKIPSKQLIKQILFFIKSSPKLWFITGLIDGDGSFYTTIFRNNEYKIGWQVQAIFSITLGMKSYYYNCKIIFSVLVQ